jgi:hypothetical protein
MNEVGSEVESEILSEPRVGYRKTYPIEFGGRRWWLTEEEMHHLKLIQQYFSETWEDEIYKRMDTLSLGDPERDLNLQQKIRD